MKTYRFIVRYDMEDLVENHLFADSYLVKLIKDLDNVVYLGVETAVGEEGMPREHFFKTEGLDATLEALSIFSDQDENFAKSFLDLDELEDDGALTMEYKEIPHEPITEDEREYSRASIEQDPRKIIALMEDEDFEIEGLVDVYGGDDEEDDDEGPN